MAKPTGSDMRHLEDDLCKLIRLTLDHEELVRVAQSIADADKSLLDFCTKKELLRLIRLKVRAGEANGTMCCLPRCRDKLNGLGGR